MGRRINPIKFYGVKESLKKGRKPGQALIENGYAPSTARNACSIPVLIEARKEVMAELKAKELNSDYFINKVEKQVINKTEDPDIKRKGIADQARYAGIDKQQVITNIWNFDNIEGKDLDALTKLARRRTSG